MIQSKSLTSLKFLTRTPCGARQSSMPVKNRTSSSLPTKRAVGPLCFSKGTKFNPLIVSSMAENDQNEQIIGPRSFRGARASHNTTAKTEEAGDPKLKSMKIKGTMVLMKKNF